MGVKTRKKKKKTDTKESRNDMSSWLEEAEMEYRADLDDAWYSVRVAAEENGDVLRVKFCGFSEEYDKVVRVSELKSKRDIHNLSERFRPMSVQVQDSDCSKVSVGDIVCASFAFREDDVRFYDALVDGVFFSLSLSL